MTTPPAVPTIPTNRRTVLITGTSSGIGLATAVATAAAGWTTVATMRDLTRATALQRAADTAGVTLDIRQLDVTDPASADDCINGVVADYGQIGALINNAGAAHVGTLETDDLNEIRACLEVNFFAVIGLSKLALPHLRASKGRLLTISSVGGIIGQPFNEAYCAAKFAVEGFMESLAPVAAAVGVTVGVVEPGAVASEFVNNAGLDIVAMLAGAGAYTAPLGAYLDRVTSQFAGNAQAASDVAATIVAALAADPLPFRTQTSDWARQFVATKITDLDGSAVQHLTGAWVGTR